MAKKKLSTIDRTRHANLMHLFEEFKRTHPGRGTVTRFAVYVDISYTYLSQLRGKLRTIGDEVAAKLEDRFNRPAGWMDIPRSEWEPKSAIERAYFQQIITAFREYSEDEQEILLRQINELLKKKHN